MNQLVPCPECRRHVIVSETSCPFCSCSLADAFANGEPRALPRARLGRAAMFAFGVLAIGACTERGRSPDAAVTDAVPTDAERDAGVPDDADGDAGVPIYAAAPTPDAGPTKTSRS